jgi:hypothetical protein
MQALLTLYGAVPALVGQAVAPGRRHNDVVWVLIVIPIAAVIFMGLIGAWFWYCQQRGMWPALDMPSWSSGGTWKLYCKR